MNRLKKYLLVSLSLLVCAALMLSGTAFASDFYIENEFGYVDAVMDSSGGIPDDAEGRLARIRDVGVLRVATEPYFAPQEFIDSTQSGQDCYVGADMELARMIAERMGVKLEIVPMNFSRVLTSLTLGECDLAISALAFTPGRAAQWTLSRGYFFSGETSGSGLLIRSEDREEIHCLDDLAGRDLAAQRGSQQESILADQISDYRQFRRVSTVQDVYLLLQRGKADAAAVDVDTALDYIESTPGCGLMLVEGLRFRFDAEFSGDRIAARKGETQLIAFVNDIIREVVESGQYMQWYRDAELYASWLGL